MMNRKAALSLLLLAATNALADEPKEVVIDFEQAEVGTPVPSWTEQGVAFSLASAPKQGKAAGRVMFFPYLSTTRKGLLNAMATEQSIPVQAKFSHSVSSVTVVFWASTGCPARLQAFDKDDKLVDETSVPAAPGRKSPGDPVPEFELTVKAAEIAVIRFSGPRTGEFLAADELRFTPVAEK